MTPQHAAAMSLEEHLPGGFLPTTVETVARSARARSVWPTFFWLACWPMEVMPTGRPRHYMARFGIEKVGATRGRPT